MDRVRSNPWAVLFVLCLGFFMILLDTTIVNIAIPSIVDALHATLDQILWVINAYILVYAVLLITAGRLGDLHGQRNMFALGMAIFITASAVCGFAQSTEALIAARVAQGVGGALLTPQTLALITTIFPPERRGAAFGVWGAVGGIAAVAGPTLGGYIVTYWNWRWIFFVNLPIGIIALAATFLIIPDIRTGRQHRLDYVGVVLSSLGLFLIVFGLIEGGRYNWGEVVGPISIPMIIAVGVALEVVFFLFERTQPEPLVPLSLFDDRNFVIMNWVSAAMFFGMLGLFLPITIYFQSALGLSALQAGLAVAPMSFTSMIVAPLSGRLADRIGGKFILMVGLVLYASGMALVNLRATPDALATSFLVPFILAGIGQGCVFAPLLTVAMRGVRPQMAGAASGVLNTTRQLGGVIGSAVVGALLQTNLATAMQQQAAAIAAQLPQSLRAGFIQGFASAESGGLEVGRTQGGGFQLPPGVPAQVVAQIGPLVHDVFLNSFVSAMHATLFVPIGVVLLGALSCLLIQQRRPTTEPQRAEVLVGE